MTAKEVARRMMAIAVSLPNSQEKALLLELHDDYVYAVRQARRDPGMAEPHGSADVMPGDPEYRR